MFHPHEGRILSKHCLEGSKKLCFQLSEDGVKHGAYKLKAVAQAPPPVSVKAQELAGF